MAYSRSIPLLAWEPDADPLTPGVLLDCDGFYGSPKGLRTLPSWVVSTIRLPEPARGGHSATLTTGTQVTVVGTTHHLWREQAGQWVAFDSGQTFNTTTAWRFAVFGDDIIAVNGLDPPQLSRVGHPFSPMADYTQPGNSPPPVAALVAVVDEGIFLVRPSSNVWIFSPNVAQWEPDIATGVVTAPLFGTPGPITAIHRTRGGVVIYKESSFYIGRFIGSPLFWSFDSVSENVGVAANEVVANADDVHYFLGRDDFYSFDGASLRRLENNVKEHLFRTLPVSRRDQFTARFDPINSLVIWHHPSATAGLGNDTRPVLDSMLLYSLRTGKWTRSMPRDSAGEPVVAEAVLQPTLRLRPRLSYAEFAAQFLMYDNLDITYNDPRLEIGFEGTVGALITNTHALATESGPSVGGSLLTGEYGDGNSYMMLSRVRPIFAEYPADRVGHLQVLKRRINGYPVPDPGPFPQPGLGPQAWLTKDGTFNVISTARALQMRLSFNTQCEITSVVYDAQPAGAE